MFEKETVFANNANNNSKKYDSISFEKMQKLIQNFLNIITIRSIKDFNKACKESNKNIKNK